MARFAVSLTVDRSTVDNERFSASHKIADPIAASGYAAAKTAFEAALAVLVADGASPTQAHVTTANSTYTTLAATLAAPPSASDVVVSVNATNVPTRTCLARAFDQILQAFASTDALTA